MSRFKLKSTPAVVLFLPVIFFFFAACRTSPSENRSDDEMLNHKNSPSGYFSARQNEKHTAAVLTFTSSGGSIASFDAFVTDEVIRRMSKAKNLQLVERSRLEILLKEQSISESGVLSKNNSSKIGKLLSVKNLIMGNYSYKKDSFHVKGRIVDSVSGEVKTTFRFSMSYPQRKTAEDNSTVQTEKGCEQIQKPIFLALRDLRTPPAVANAVREAVKIPFYGKPCKVHQRVMIEFQKGKLYPSEYHRFLYRTLEKMERPNNEYDAIREIFTYFASDNDISEEEWAASREVLKKAWHPFHMSFIFHPDKYPMPVIQRRSLELIKLARNNKIGLPFRLSEYRVARDILSIGFLQSSEPGIEFSLYILSSLKNPANASDKEFKNFLGAALSCYRNSLDRDRQKRALDTMISLYKMKTPEKKMSVDLWV
ncbi:MAG: CsgG/HfaB family protein, partial [Spirochaetia bacterium]|nr:CsgG/HfaB family protein [Spirochaetia bacterium]